MKKVYLFNVSLFFFPLTAPGFPKSMDMFIFITILLTPIYIVYFFPKIQKDRHYFILCFFSFIVLITMITRGLGFQFLGSENIGGARYLKIFCTIILVLISKNISIDSRYFKEFLSKTFLLAFIFAIIQSLTSAEILPNISFIIDGRPLENIESSISETRYFEFKTAAVYLLLYILLSRKNNYIHIKHFLGLGFVLVFCILSGFRTSILITTSLFFFSIIFCNYSTAAKKKIILSFSVVIVLGALTIIANKERLPTNLIRTLSFIPGISNENATQTSDWRVMVWGLALKYELPKYLWLGKGLTFGANNYPNIFGVSDFYLTALDFSNYHNGPVSLLIIFGIPGFLAITLYHFEYIKRIIKYRVSVEKLTRENLVVYSTLVSWYFLEYYYFI